MGSGFEEVFVFSLSSIAFLTKMRKISAGLRTIGRSAVCFAVLAGAPGFEIRACAQSTNSRVPRNVLLRRENEDSKVIVVGLLGGFVSSNDSHHPEVQLIRELQHQYPTGAYFGLFENHKLNQAHTAILQQLGIKVNGQVAQIVLFGHSWGAEGVVQLARMLERDGIPVALTVQVDAVAKPFRDDAVIPPNVAEAVNFYQTHGLIHGRSLIRAADPERTTIIGNFRREYKTEPPACHRFPWYSRVFTKGHIEIECDPDLWSEIKTLLNPYLPHQVVAQEHRGAIEEQPDTSAKEFAAPVQIESFNFDKD